MNVAPLPTSAGSQRRLVVLLGMLALLNSGCALIPTWDDIDAATATVKDTVTGRGKRNRQIQTFAEARILELGWRNEAGRHLCPACREA